MTMKFKSVRAAFIATWSPGEKCLDLSSCPGLGPLSYSLMIVTELNKI